MYRGAVNPGGCSKGGSPRCVCPTFSRCRSMGDCPARVSARVPRGRVPATSLAEFALAGSVPPHCTSLQAPFRARRGRARATVFAVRWLYFGAASPYPGSTEWSLNHAFHCVARTVPRPSGPCDPLGFVRNRAFARDHPVAPQGGRASSTRGAFIWTRARPCRACARREPRSRSLMNHSLATPVAMFRPF